MKTNYYLIILLAILSFATFPSAYGDEILLRNGNRIDYGPTWEKNDMIWFYFFDSGVAGITKEAIVDKKTILGASGDQTFFSRDYGCQISIPEGWHSANAVQALDIMPLDNSIKKEYRKLEPSEVMAKMGFLVTIYKDFPWDPGKYNPCVLIRLDDLQKYPGVTTPVEYLKNTQFLLASLYSNFTMLQAPEAFVLNNVPSAKQKFHCAMMVGGKAIDVTQWQYAFIKDKTAYVVAGLNASEDFKTTEGLFLKTMKTFRFTY
jgi:hypothetical protein